MRVYTNCSRRVSTIAQDLEQVLPGVGLGALCTADVLGRFNLTEEERVGLVSEVHVGERER